jgi:hypothetical protein
VAEPDSELSPRSTNPGPGTAATPPPKAHPFLKLDHRELDGFARLGLTGAEVHVYLALRRFDHVNSRGESKGLVWPSIATLAARTGKGRTQVKKALGGLEGKGVIERLTAHWHGRSNQWKIHYPGRFYDHHECLFFQNHAGPGLPPSRTETAVPAVPSIGRGRLAVLPPRRSGLPGGQRPGGALSEPAGRVKGRRFWNAKARRDAKNTKRGNPGPEEPPFVFSGQ